MFAALAAAALMTVPVNACPPPPPPPEPRAGESEQAYKARLEELAAAERAQLRAAMASRQAALWNESPIIFVGQVERVRPRKIYFHGPGQSALIRPVRWIKGKGGAGSFWLRYEGESSCGPYGGGDAVDGKVGQRFVIFASRGRLTSSAVIDSIGAARAIDERITTAITSSPGKR